MHAPTRLGTRPTGALPRWLTLAAGLVVVLGMLAGAFHHHAPDETTQHPCVVCSLHHTPATPVAVVEPQAPAPSFERIAVVVASAPRTVVVACAPARAPPAA
jgi:hypothetical protein